MNHAHANPPSAAAILAGLECSRPSCDCHKAARRGKGNTHCPMPGHGTKGRGDVKPSLSVEGGDRVPQLNCFAGCDNDAIREELKRRGLYGASDRDGWTDAARRASRGGSTGPRPDDSVGVTLAQLAEAKRLDIAFLRGLGLHDATHKDKPAVAIPYRDRDGKVLFERLRVGLTGKRFHQPYGVPLAPYGRDRLEQARTAGRVVLVEGESDCWACWKADEPAYGLPGMKTWKPAYAADLEGIADVWLWQEPGAADFGERVKRDVPRLRVLRAPDGIKDLADVHAQGLNVPSFLAGLRAFAPAVGQAADAATVGEQVTLGTIPGYPTAILPGPLRELAAAYPNLAPALIAGAGVAALAAAIGPRVEIEVQPGWRRRPILWVVNIAPRGAGKSPAQAAAFQPLRDHDAAVLPGYRTALGVWRKTPPKRRGPRPSDPTLLGNDLTLEALARRLDRAGGAAALDIDELSQFLRGLGEYKKGGGGDRGRLLALWTGDPWRSERVTDELDIYVMRPVVVICGGLQPALHELLGPESDGLRPRWLPHVAAMPQISMGGVAGPAPQSWADLLHGLIQQRERERVLTFEPPARAGFFEHQHRWKTAGAGDEGESVSAALVKADQQALAMLLVLAEAEQRPTIDAELVERAAAAIDFSLDCWRALPEQGALALSRKDEVLDQGVERLRSYLEDHGGQATRRDLLRHAAAGARTAADLDELLRRYVAVYPGTVRDEATSGGGPQRVVVSAPVRDASRHRSNDQIHTPGKGVVVSADNGGGAGRGEKISLSEFGDPATVGDVSGSEGVEGADIAAADNAAADNVTAREPAEDDARHSPNGRAWEVRL